MMVIHLKAEAAGVPLPSKILSLVAAAGLFAGLVTSLIGFPQGSGRAALVAARRLHGFRAGAVVLGAVSALALGGRADAWEDGALRRTYVRLTMTFTVMYGALYGVGQWLEQARGVDPGWIVLMLQVSVVSAVVALMLGGSRSIRFMLGLDRSDIEHPGTTQADRLLLYFTSGTTSRPRLDEQDPASSCVSVRTSWPCSTRLLRPSSEMTSSPS